MPNDNNYEEIKSGTYSTGKFINDAFALIDENENEEIIKVSHMFQNFQRYKISIGAVNKNINDFSKKNLQKNVLWLNYKQQVMKMVLNDSLNSIGINGYIDIHNTGSYADIILHRHNSFYIVINITIIEEDFTTKLEPYIFEISRVENLSGPTDEERKLRLHLLDLVTSICSSHNIATVIKMTEGRITHLSSYKEVFAEILDYVKSHIKTNMLGEYDYRKDLYFTDNMELSSSYKTKDEDSEDESADNHDMSELIKASFSKMNQESTILDALYILQQDCGRTLKTPKVFSSTNQTAGDLIIPFYFKEEYQSLVKEYGKVWKEEDKNNLELGVETTSSLLSGNLKNATNTVKDYEKNINNRKLRKNNAYGGKESVLLYRNMTMRDIYMPFYLAFVDKGDNKNFIFESINPEMTEDGAFTDYEKEFRTAPGYRKNCVVHEIQSFPYNIEVVKRRWKNIVFVDTQNSTSSVLIFLRWFYNYFSTIFLNNSITNMKYVPNLLPSFLAKSKIYNVGEAKEEGEVFDSLYDTHNSNIFVCKTPDSRNEALREMGKNIASFILSNNRYILKLDGDLFRRPNEIIKFSQFTGGKSYFSDLNSMLSVGVNLSNDPYTFLYVTSVTHIFSEDGYYNYIEGCKFCENMKYKLPKLGFMK